MKSDIGTVVLPAIALGISLVGLPDVDAFFEGLVWLLLHLLAFDTRNQIIGLEEDRLSKPNRPIAAGRISLRAAQILNVAFIGMSLLDSARHGLLVQSVIYQVCAAAYNDWDLARYWVTKSGMICIGLGIWCWGTVVCFDHGRPLSPTSVNALLITALLLATTVHAQDFRDVDGDAAIGRRTLPMVLSPAFGRWSLAALLVGWSAVLVRFWLLPAGVAALLYILAAVTSVAFVRSKSSEGDKDACWWYNAWFTACLTLPLFHRL
ncbi:UbiA prenyltransferase family [Schizophyllum amplum]|uniref:UbiA prenyltransferase family n=1 Tax=Schizophyllum amplum TaxID=97359 RepID=A0A550CV25_9AGAR|nr:UbiA prenyltransferase family [Auriculariopsis ampla]